MTEEFDKELTALLDKHFGKDWEFNWKGEDGGFSLQLWVWNQPEREELNEH